MLDVLVSSAAAKTNGQYVEVKAYDADGLALSAYRWFDTRSWAVKKHKYQMTARAARKNVLKLLGTMMDGMQPSEKDVRRILGVFE